MDCGCHPALAAPTPCRPLRLLCLLAAVLAVPSASAQAAALEYRIGGYASAAAGELADDPRLPAPIPQEGLSLCESGLCKTRFTLDPFADLRVEGEGVATDSQSGPFVLALVIRADAASDCSAEGSCSTTVDVQSQRFGAPEASGIYFEIAPGDGFPIGADAEVVYEWAGIAQTTAGAEARLGIERLGFQGISLSDVPFEGFPPESAFVFRVDNIEISGDDVVRPVHVGRFPARVGDVLGFHFGAHTRLAAGGDVRSATGQAINAISVRLAVPEPATGAAALAAGIALASLRRRGARGASSQT